MLWKVSAPAETFRLYVNSWGRAGILKLCRVWPCSAALGNSNAALFWTLRKQVDIGEPLEVLLPPHVFGRIDHPLGYPISNT